MITRKPNRRGLQLPEAWRVETRVQVNGRWLEPGTEVSIKGEKGRFRFQKRVQVVSGPMEGAVWLDFIGGAKGCTAFRSFHADRVKTVHRIERTRENVDVPR